jgi:hypothetical protein
MQNRYQSGNQETDKYEAEKRHSASPQQGKDPI